MQVLQLGVVPYPESLSELRKPPDVLYAEGRLEVLGLQMVAVVGTRHPTPYGERVTRAIATALARAGACVVSGLALGLDTVAHQAALDAGGATCAVLGTGLDVCHPKKHAHIQAAIAERGLLLTEFAAGTEARPSSFPQRNRIIAGLASLVIVVEAGRKSGALITAGIAQDLHRDVAAVPGAIDAPASQGCNALIRDGANVIADALDVLVLAGLTAAPTAAPMLSGDEAVVWTALGEGPSSAETVALRSNLSASRCLSALTTLELAGLVVGTSIDTYARMSRHA